MHLDIILNKALTLNASDIHLTVGAPPIFRIGGNLKPLESTKFLSAPEIESYVKKIINSGKYLDTLQKEKQVDLIYYLPDLGRFRVNIYNQKGNKAVSIRVVNLKVPLLKELGLPKAVQELTHFKSGLILVTGQSGSGKSTTLAALIDKINREKETHIITLEDPIEFIHVHKKSIVNQREIGTDAIDFNSALKAALRQDPDIILVGEMRDSETIKIALTAAETGHLVFATLHTMNAPQTIERIIDAFPSSQQNQIRIQLANTLQAIIAQQLLPSVSENKRVVAVELLLAIPAIRNLIREGKTHQILSIMQASGKLGMQTMEKAVKVLYDANLISEIEFRSRYR